MERTANGHSRLSGDAQMRSDPNRRIDPALRTNYIARNGGVTMAIREILKLPDKRLRLRSEPVKQIDAGIRKLVDDMFETMYKAPGIGLAAIQLGVAKRVITMDLSKKEDDHKPQVFINPEILWQSEERAKLRGRLLVDSGLL